MISISAFILLFTGLALVARSRRKQIRHGSRADTSYFIALQSMKASGDHQPDLYQAGCAFAWPKPLKITSEQLQTIHYAANPSGLLLVGASLSLPSSELELFYSKFLTQSSLSILNAGIAPVKFSKIHKGMVWFGIQVPEQPLRLYLEREGPTLKPISIHRILASIASIAAFVESLDAVSHSISVVMENVWMNVSTSDVQLCQLDISSSVSLLTPNPIFDRNRALARQVGQIFEEILSLCPQARNERLIATVQDNLDPRHQAASSSLRVAAFLKRLVQEEEKGSIPPVQRKMTHHLSCGIHYISEPSDCVVVYDNEPIVMSSLPRYFAQTRFRHLCPREMDVSVSRAILVYDKGIVPCTFSTLSSSLLALIQACFILEEFAFHGFTLGTPSLLNFFEKNGQIWLLGGSFVEATALSREGCAQQLMDVIRQILRQYLTQDERIAQFDTFRVDCVVIFSQLAHALSSLASTCDVRNSLVRKYSRSELSYCKALGAGQFGEVSLHLIRQEDSFVAVKSVHDGHGLEEFNEELRIMMWTHHPNLVHLLGEVDDPTHPALIIEFVSNGSLDAWLVSLASHQNLSTERLSILLQVWCRLLYLKTLYCDRSVKACRTCTDSILYTAI